MCDGESQLLLVLLLLLILPLLRVVVKGCLGYYMVVEEVER